MNMMNKKLIKNELKNEKLGPFIKFQVSKGSNLFENI